MNSGAEQHGSSGSGETGATVHVAARYGEVGDESLVLAALVGDLRAFDELVRRYRSAVTLIAAQTLGTARWAGAAEDVAQEAFLLAFKALPQLDEPAKFAGWLCAITRHRAARVGRREARSQPTEPSEIDRLLLSESRELSAVLRDPAESHEKSAARDELARALAGLRAEYRSVLFLHYYEEWPLARIAGFLSLPVTTIKWRLHNGRALLRRALAGPSTLPIKEQPSHDPDRRQTVLQQRAAGQGDRSTSPAPPAQRHRRPRPEREPDRQPSGRSAHGHAPL